ncbi:MAG TPA: pyridoxal phosphate-dependent aminotransferase [Flavobacteriales bacterium]|nr:pyridoxal phosphate-dependent aminotransferase [Flavobacteriales bacterium]
MIKINELVPSASMELTRMAKVIKDEGRKVYTLSIGDTHFSLPRSISSKLHSLPEISSHYGPAQGVFELRKAMAERYTGYEPDDVVIVPGLKQGFFYALEAIEKKRVAVLEPSWLGYKATCTLAGCDYIPVNTYLPNWKKTLKDIDFDVLMLCSPNNPDGGILSKNEILDLREIIASKNAWVFVDIIYERYAYGRTNLLTRLNPLLDYTKILIGNGFSKSHAMTGYRVGYLMIKDQNVRTNILLIQQNLATCASSHAQHLLTLCPDPEEISYFSEYYEGNREAVLKIFPEWSKFTPKGGFYFFVDLTIYGITDASEFCAKALMNDGIAMVPGSAYGTGFDNYVRVSFSLDRSELKEALNKLKNVIKTYYA